MGQVEMDVGGLCEGMTRLRWALVVLFWALAIWAG